jgi:hypothetical protein
LLVERVEALLVLRERPVAAADARPRGRGVDLDVNREGVLAESSPDLLRLDGAAAERDDRGALVDERLERGLGFEQAEFRLAALAEHLRDRLTQRALELAVEVDEPPAEALRRLRSERGLARAHEADEREVPV